jgi:hypothetical protein
MNWKGRPLLRIFSSGETHRSLFQAGNPYSARNLCQSPRSPAGLSSVVLDGLLDKDLRSLTAISIQIVGHEMLAMFTHRMFFCVPLIYISVLVYFTCGSVRSFTNAFAYLSSNRIYLRKVCQCRCKL